MNTDGNRYFAIALGSTAAEVRRQLGEPSQITPVRREEQWLYENGRFVLTFAGANGDSPLLIRIARRPRVESPATGHCTVGAYDHTSLPETSIDYKKKER